ncbi:glycerate kinase type-2 family protein [Rhizobium wenxiniae]|uniref:Hydroxypyruvate reductase n=1 Tax=Rhizobium wenxiniae TaxID=1737357 RepID=A0A7X0D3K6_9HYPH|nr:glycerate kinase [Rhizobium wenxiniae]MBB6165551.1 hydroxypyruvate reductase [Rhizobium wenxiniae]GGG17661.1 hydroxypyruvate reductase [Rhizobium wenxiniae]
MSWDDRTVRALLHRMFDAAVESAAPAAAVLRNLPPKPAGRCIVIGAGKASAAMAAALDAAWPDINVSGVVVTRYGHAVPAGRIRIIEASHPVPDEMSLEAGRLILRAVQGLAKEDMVISMISGGGSALLVAPSGDMTLADKQAVNEALLNSGATIREMNAVRKQLSLVKGGRLAMAAKPAKVVTLVISDVPGDNPSDIASGPTVADDSTIEIVREILQRRRILLPARALAALDMDLETPKCGDLPTDVKIIAAPSLALAAAARVATDSGVKPLILGDAIEGEAREMGTVMAGIALSARTKREPVDGPAVILSGGEGTVSIGTVKPGRGGRNTEFLLSIAVALAGTDGIWAIAGDTDGIDGTEDAAGAIVSPDTLSKSMQAGLDAKGLLASHDSYSFFEKIGDLVKTGPTLTNVNDFRAIFVS